jgi:hypothetical protein
MGRSLLVSTTSPEAALLESGPDDRYFDYCLEPYRPRRPWRGKLRSENLLWLSLEVAGAVDALRPPLLALRDSIGRDMTIWGVKWDGERLFWEIYVYDPQREEPRARVESVAEVLRPWVRLVPEVSAAVPYAMFSFDLDLETMARGTIPALNAYLTGEQGHAGRSYVVTADGIELDNTYRFMDPKREIEQLLPLVKASIFVDYGEPSRLSKVLMPELFACRKCCVAKKRRNDGIYFSGIAVEQLAFFLRRFEYPERIRDFVSRHEQRLDHLSFDVGIDYRTAADGASLAYPKTSFYGSL